MYSNFAKKKKKKKKKNNGALVVNITGFMADPKTFSKADLDVH